MPKILCLKLQKEKNFSNLEDTIWILYQGPVNIPS